MKNTFPKFLTEDVDTVAQKLLGCFFVREIDGQKIVVRIVETESYDQTDEASHAYRGIGLKNKTMFGPSGFLYVYFTYGMHYCCNVVTGSEGYGSGVLIRAVEPVENVELMEELRGVTGKNVSNGPGKLCKALAIDFNLKGHDLRTSPLQLVEGSLKAGEEIVETTRIGISKNKDAVKRFYIKGNEFVSKI